MKYIRVKDKSHEWLTTFVDYENARNKATELGLTYSLKIVKQADSIEELCDAFVLNTGKLHKIATITFEELKDTHIKFIDVSVKTIIYGAIWTDKGLIYVAKMNDKGELELL